MQFGWSIRTCREVTGDKAGRSSNTGQRSLAWIWEAVGNHCSKGGVVRPLSWEEGGSPGRVGYKEEEEWKAWESGFTRVSWD